MSQRELINTCRVQPDERELCETCQLTECLSNPKYPPPKDWLIVVKSNFWLGRGCFVMPENKGYTDKFGKAGLFSRKEALESEKLQPDKYVALPKSIFNQ